MPYPSRLSKLRILEEAVRIVDEAGIDALSTRVLARRLGVRAPSLYRYYPDMETLVREVNTRFFAELTEEVGRQDTLVGMGRAYWRYGTQHPNRYEVVACRSPDPDQLPVEVRLQATEQLHQMAARLNPDNPLVSARMIWSYIHGAVSLRLNWPTRPGLDPEEAFVAGLDALEQWLAAARATETAEDR